MSPTRIGGKVWTDAQAEKILRASRVGYVTFIPRSAVTRDILVENGIIESADDEKYVLTTKGHAWVEDWNTPRRRDD